MKSGRSESSGNLRNFKAMDAGKLKQVYRSVVAEDNDPSAIILVKQEMINRGFLTELTDIEICRLEELHDAVHNLLAQINNRTRRAPLAHGYDWFSRRGWRI